MQRIEPDIHQRADTANTMTCGRLVLNLDGFIVTIADQDIPVTLTEFLNRRKC